MRYLTLVQAKIDGEEAPKVTTLGKVAIDIEKIEVFYEIHDKYDVKIEGVIMLTLGNERYLVAKTFDALLEEIAAAKLE